MRRRSSSRLTPEQRRVLADLRRTTEGYESAVRRADAWRDRRDMEVLGALAIGISERLVATTARVNRGWIYKIKRARGMV